MDADADADQDLITVRSRLRASLEGINGRLRATDAIRLAGFKHRTYLRALLVARSMRELGWDQVRCRFNGTLETAYARGSGLEREIILDVVERETSGKLTVKAKEP